ncbi:MAG: tetratricopeptide repeat protein [Bacteroidota bacterium]|nr:tetratricopeptide repeat protein [Bacteroidota bacterium]
MKKGFLIAVFLGFISLSVKAQLYQVGLRLIDFEKYEAARDIFGVLVKNNPSNGDYYYYLGQTYINLLNIDSAEFNYNAGIKIAPANPANYAGLGEIELMLGNKAKATEYFNKALSFSMAKNGTYTDIRAITLVATGMVSNDNIKMLDEAEVLIRMGYDQNKRDYNLLIAGGDVYLERNDGGNAATFYERAIAVDPKNPKAYVRVAVIWLRVKNFESAQSDLNRAFEKDSLYAPALKYQAELYYAQHKFEKAKETYLKYLQHSEPSTANQIRFARILFLSKEYDEALTKIEELQKKDTLTLILYRLRGYSTYEVIALKNDIEKARLGLAALEYYMKKVDPKKIIAADYEYLGMLQAKVSGKDSLALINLYKALEMNPANVEIYKEIAKTYNKMKRFEEAAATYEFYLTKAKRTNAGDYFLMGKMHYYAKNFYKADTAFMKVNELIPEYAEAYLWRGNANSNIDPTYKTEIAKENFEKFISVLKADSVKFIALKDKNKANLIAAYRYIGIFYLNKDNEAKAKEYFKEILELDPDNEEAKKVVYPPKQPEK